MTNSFAAAVMVTGLVLSACGESPRGEPRAQKGDSGPRATNHGQSHNDDPVSPHGDVPEAPPPVTVRFFDDSIELEAWTYCYGNGCADGAPPANPPDVGNPDKITIEYPLAGWRFDAFLSPPDEECGREFRTSLERIDDHTFVLRPAGYAGTYDVTLQGRGDGDLFTSFRWTTPSDGPLPKPKARLAVLADHDGEVDSYGIELEVRDLATTPKKASATITVRDEDGEEFSFEAKRATRGCRPEGTIYWDGPDDKGRQAAGLGEGPFTYEVELTLDGESYFATARWPDDEIEGNEPSVRLLFSPELPALS